MAVSPALGIGALEFAGLLLLEGILSTGPKRSIIWNAADATGTPVVDPKTGQPVLSALYPQIVVEELSEDDLRITDHPVEQGAAITDHAFKEPSSVQIRAAWSAGAQGSPSPIPVQGNPNFLSDLYATLLQLQANRSIVTLQTGKRLYTNMLLKSLRLPTDEKTENVLLFTATFRQIIVVTTQLLPPADPETMANPAADAGTVSLGKLQLSPPGSVNINALRGSLPLSLQDVTVPGS